METIYNFLKFIFFLLGILGFILFFPFILLPLFITSSDYTEFKGAIKYYFTIPFNVKW